jgi:NhaP-type Na+/H+ and K+/H+ antiporter
MYHLLLLSGIIILACVVANQFSDKLGLPALLLVYGAGDVLWIRRGGEDPLFRL